MSNREFRLEFAGKYADLSQRNQEMFLVRLGYWLTVEARNTYKAGEEEILDPARLRIFNEAEHRILDQLDKMMRNIQQRYPDDVFANILVDQFEMLRFKPNYMLELIGNISRRH